ncbi:MAG: sigma-54-dependent Fis family transcriptional regulator [Polyangiaceae bacterium]|nr:sigma-54-dependent Fis family transcriptional regulator [Myxococcales bacterium]MCB9584701.1 sigma-54-dependent Fis family transcriptional regulator [Polyangiaceae bacterium]
MPGPPSSRREDATTVTNVGPESTATADAAVPALVLCWSRSEPHRVGEVGFPESEGETSFFGRGTGNAGDRRLLFAPQHPNAPSEALTLQGKGISRDQLRVTREGDRLRIENIGRCAAQRNGVDFRAAHFSIGDTLHLDRQVLLLCVSRAPVRLRPRFFPERALGEFGRGDGVGLIGESSAVWALRDRVAFCALADEHVLVHGSSGTGKELVASAVHELSERRRARLVSRNAATIPSGIAAAELFGNRKDYPNAGVPERAGLVGEADGSSLFLDELGELPPELQSQLLRFLDSGEYTRLGEDRARRADVRLVAATNRDPSELKHDLFARLKLSIETPDLNQHREDIPLLARDLVARAAKRSPMLVQRFVRDTSRGPEFYVSPRLMERLLRHSYQLHVRELDALLWQAMADASGDELDLSEGVEQRLSGEGEGGAAGEVGSEDIDAERLREVLSAVRGNKTEAAKQLGLTSRFALYRLMKRLNVDAQ